MWSWIFNSFGRQEKEREIDLARESVFKKLESLRGFLGEGFEFVNQLSKEELEKLLCILQSNLLIGVKKEWIDIFNRNRIQIAEIDSEISKSKDFLDFFSLVARKVPKQDCGKQSFLSSLAIAKIDALLLALARVKVQKQDASVLGSKLGTLGINIPDQIVKDIHKDIFNPELGLTLIEVVAKAIAPSQEGFAKIRNVYKENKCSPPLIV